MGRVGPSDERSTGCLRTSCIVCSVWPASTPLMTSRSKSTGGGPDSSSPVANLLTSSSVLRPRRRRRAPARVVEPSHQVRRRSVTARNREAQCPRFEGARCSVRLEAARREGILGGGDGRGCSREACSLWSLRHLQLRRRVDHRELRWLSLVRPVDDVEPSGLQVDGEDRMSCAPVRWVTARLRP